jgi:hypothetical protein
VLTRPEMTKISIGAPGFMPALTRQSYNISSGFPSRRRNASPRRGLVQHHIHSIRRTAPLVVIMIGCAVRGKPTHPSTGSNGRAPGANPNHSHPIPERRGSLEQVASGLTQTQQHLTLSGRLKRAPRPPPISEHAFRPLAVLVRFNPGRQRSGAIWQAQVRKMTQATASHYAHSFGRKIYCVAFLTELVHHYGTPRRG